MNNASYLKRIYLQDIILFSSRFINSRIENYFLAIALKAARHHLFFVRLFAALNYFFKFIVFYE